MSPKPAPKTKTAKGSKGRSGEKIKVFISYAHDDYPIAASLRKEIKSIDELRFEVFLDYETIELGKDWQT
mgnify:CR=1 FL=1